MPGPLVTVTAGQDHGISRLIGADFRVARSWTTSRTQTLFFKGFRRTVCNIFSDWPPKMRPITPSNASVTQNAGFKLMRSTDTNVFKLRF